MWFLGCGQESDLSSGATLYFVGANRTPPAPLPTGERGVWLSLVYPLIRTKID
jgi:hypothetical protein